MYKYVIYGGRGTVRFAYKDPEAHLRLGERAYACSIILHSRLCSWIYVDDDGRECAVIGIRNVDEHGQATSTFTPVYSHTEVR
jgi:hypothetical protein